MAPDSIQMEHGDLLIEVLGQEVHFFPPNALVFPEVFICARTWIAEAVRHYETWVTGCASEVYEPPLGEKVDGVSLWEVVSVDLRLDVLVAYLIVIL